MSFTLEFSLAKCSRTVVISLVSARGLGIQMAPRRKIRKAVIPVAGYGTRLFPATKGIKKEFFPIVDRDGLAKPLIQILLEEALESGIERVCLVVQKGGDKPIRDYFAGRLARELEKKLSRSAAYKTQIHRLRKIANRIEFAYQREQLGYGDAVYQARRFVGSKPFLLMLGDHFYVSRTNERCAIQTLRAWQRRGGNLIAVGRTRARYVKHRGIIGATALRGSKRTYRIERFCEKPSAEYARRSLRVAGLRRGTYLCMFGLYVLSPEIFDCLGYQLRHKLLQRGEIQLTTALEMLRQQGSDFFAFEPQGDFLDVGLPETYADAVTALLKS
jgi:UTP--glucose-1-phosphate uridylyltransferase